MEQTPEQLIAELTKLKQKEQHRKELNKIRQKRWIAAHPEKHEEKKKLYILTQFVRRMEQKALKEQVEE